MLQGVRRDKSGDLWKLRGLEDISFLEERKRGSAEAVANKTKSLGTTFPILASQEKDGCIQKRPNLWRVRNT